MKNDDGTRSKAAGTLLLAGWTCLVLTLQGCGGGGVPELQGITLSDDDMIDFGPADTTYVDNSYRLSPGDRIELDFLFDRSLDATITVRPDGGINLPILGDIIVAGQTPGALSRQIAQAYGQYYTNPQLSINLTEYAPPQVYVLGEVRYPKAVVIRPGMTVLGAIAEAGGSTDLSSMKSTVLVRRTGQSRAVARRFNPLEFARGQGVSSDLFLQDYDIIYVPRSFIGKVTTAVDQIFGTLTAAPVLYLRGWEAFNTDRVYGRITTPNNTQQTPVESETP